MTERSRIGRKWFGLFCGVILSYCSAAPAFGQTQDDFFNDTVLQEVRLVVNTRDWQLLKEHFDDNDYYPADLTWNGVTVRNIGIRSRGNATRNPLKPGLRIDVNHYVTNQLFLGLKAFSLDNMYSDASLMRESVTMQMFAKMKIPASREAHARVYVNNEYVGVYVIIESIDRGFIERLFGSEEANVERGGYLFEYQWTSPYHFEYLGPDLGEYAARFKPQTRDTDSGANLYAPLEAMIQTITEASDDDFAAAVGQYLDLRQFMTYLAVESFMVEWDGIAGFAGANNFYLYRFRSGLTQFFPKDKDSSLAYLDVPVSLRFDGDVLVRRAMATPSLRQTFLDALQQCVDLAAEAGPDDSRGWIEREVTRETALVAPAVAEDPVYPYSFDDFVAVTSSLLEFARLRPSYVACQAGVMADSLDLGADPSIPCSSLIEKGTDFSSSPLGNPLAPR